MYTPKVMFQILDSNFTTAPKIHRLNRKLRCGLCENNKISQACNVFFSFGTSNLIFLSISGNPCRVILLRMGLARSIFKVDSN